MDAFELLKNDHKKVAQLFEEIESASGPSKQQLFRQLKGELDIHAHVEEKFLYPALENKEESREITLEAYEEHKVVKDLLAELASESPSDEWDAKLKVLRENVEHHVEEEEGELFDKAENVLSDEQIERLGAEMEAEKARQNGAPAPRSDPPKQRPAKSRTAAKKAESPGVLKRLAILVGLGDSSSTGERKSAGSSRKAASTKSAGTKKAAASKKSAGSKKSSGTKKSGSSVKKSGKQATKKTAAKTTSKKSGAKKTSNRQASGARATKKTATTRGKARKK